jgi:cell division protein FtsB
MQSKSLVLGLLAVLGVSLTGAILTRRISVQKAEIQELRQEIDELKEIQQKLEEENENLSDQLQDCTEDYQHCISGRIWTEDYPNPFNK